MGTRFEVVEGIGWGGRHLGGSVLVTSEEIEQCCVLKQPAT